MAATHSEVRRAMGQALRRLREGWELSLDDIDEASRTHGLRVTRSHLSRVENGEADLALPRFLTLMRAIGEPPGAIAEALDAFLDAREAGGEDDPARRNAEPGAAGIALLEGGDPASAASAFRRDARLAEPHRPLPDRALECWAGAEAALGRWQAAAEVLRTLVARPGRREDRTVLRLAVASLGAGQAAIGVPLAASARDGAPLVARLVEALGAPDPREPLVATLAFQGEASPELRALADIARSALCRATGQVRPAVRFAQAAVEATREGVLAAEARLALARAQGDARRPTAGLAALDRGRPLARQARIPDLLACCHLEAERLWRLAGNPEAARQALRAGRALRRRTTADPDAPRHWPLHALFAVLAPGE